MDADQLSICFKNFYYSETQLHQTNNLSIRTLEGKRVCQSIKESVLNAL